MINEDARYIDPSKIDSLLETHERVKLNGDPTEYKGLTLSSESVGLVLWVQTSHEGFVFYKKRNLILVKHWQNWWKHEFYLINLNAYRFLRPY